MLVLYLPVVITTFIYVLYWYITRTFNYWKSRGVVGPTPVPLFGNLKDTVLRKRYIGCVLKEIYNEYPNEKVVGVYRMTTPCLLIRDLDLIKHVMIKDFDLFVDRGVEFSKEGLGANLFHSDGETWKILRKQFTPLFTSGKLKNMLYLMSDRGDQFIKQIDNLCSKQSELEMRGLLQMYTMSTISACAFGLDLDIEGGEMEVLKKVDEMTLKLTYFQELDLMYPGLLKKLNRSLFPKFVSNFFYELVKKIVTQRNGAPINRHDFMDLMLELRNQGQIQGPKRNADDEQHTLELTDDVIAAQAFIFYVAGYETSATTMGFFLYEMAKNPEIQEKLIAEVDMILQKYENVTYDAINELEYLNRVFQETLRMYPIVDPLQRNAQVDYKLPGTNVTVKKGQTVIICPTGIQHDPSYYPEPERFDPDRFTVENSKNRHPCAFLPFGAGPRNCIGMRFAKVQSVICLAKFFSKFRVEMSKNTTDIDMDPLRPIAGPKGGIILSVLKR